MIERILELIFINELKFILFLNYKQFINNFYDLYLYEFLNNFKIKQKLNIFIFDILDMS